MWKNWPRRAMTSHSMNCTKQRGLPMMRLLSLAVTRPKRWNEEIFGPILCAIHILPLFDLTEFFNFAYDNFSLADNSCIKFAQTQLTKNC